MPRFAVSYVLEEHATVYVKARDKEEAEDIIRDRKISALRAPVDGIEITITEVLEE